MVRRLALTVLVVAALAPALRGDAAPRVLIQPGVTLAGVPVGGMSNEQAQAALRPAFARPVRLVYADRSWRLHPARFGARVTIADGVLQALGAQAGAAVSLVVNRWQRGGDLSLRGIDNDVTYELGPGSMYASSWPVTIRVMS